MSGTLRSVPDQTLLSTLRDQLRSESERLRGQIAVLVPGEGDLIYDENFADSGQVAAEQGENKALLAQMRDQLAEIEHALAKFESGTYGICERCGQPIAEPRLEAMPATRYCIQHA
jgi:DnaK suppressor protein